MEYKDIQMKDTGQFDALKKIACLPPVEPSKVQIRKALPKLMLNYNVCYQYSLFPAYFLSASYRFIAS